MRKSNQRALPRKLTHKTSVVTASVSSSEIYHLPGTQVWAEGPFCWPKGERTWSWDPRKGFTKPGPQETSSSGSGPPWPTGATSSWIGRTGDRALFAAPCPSGSPLAAWCFPSSWRAWGLASPCVHRWHLASVSCLLLGPLELGPWENFYHAALWILLALPTDLSDLPATTHVLSEFN